MSSPLEGRTVALAEGRQLEELAELLVREGAVPWRCPLVSIMDNPDSEPVFSWIQDVAAGKFDLVVLMTGEALRRLLEFAARRQMRDTMVAALGRLRSITRGPKPVKALREISLTPSVVAEKPTTDGVIATLRQENLRDRTVGVTLYGEPNPVLEEFLTNAGARVRTVMPYVYAPAADGDRVGELITALHQGRIDSIIFTSSPQCHRLWEVARGRNSEAELRAGLARTCVAAVGPVVAETLKQNGIRVDVCPEQGFVMKNLVQCLKRQFGRS
jgi:uroporphyrinogen-III synthase